MKIKHKRDAEDPEIKKMRIVIGDIHEIFAAHDIEVDVMLNVLIACLVGVTKAIAQAHDMPDDKMLELTVRCLRHNMKSPFFPL